MTTTRDVAEWMLAELHLKSELYQEDAASGVESRFGKQFIYENENGNPAINKSVLSAFLKITGDAVVWERGARLWRKRNEDDEPGRQQD